jgi:hypothetical protein
MPGRDVGAHATRGEVLDGKPERSAVDSVDDQAEVAGEGRDDLGGAETAKALLRCGGNEHTLAEREPGDSSACSAVTNPGCWQRGGLRVGYLVGDRRQSGG